MISLGSKYISVGAYTAALINLVDLMLIDDLYHTFKIDNFTMRRTKIISTWRLAAVISTKKKSQGSKTQFPIFGWCVDKCDYWNDCDFSMCDYMYSFERIVALHLTCATVLWDSGQTHRKITAAIHDLCPDYSTHLRTAWLSGIKKCIPQSGHRQSAQDRVSTRPGHVGSWQGLCSASARFDSLAEKLEKRWHSECQRLSVRIRARHRFGCRCRTQWQPRARAGE